MNSTPVRSVAAPSGLTTARRWAGRPGMRVRAWVFGALAVMGVSFGAGSAALAQDTSTPVYAKRILEGKAPVESGSAIDQAGCCGNLPAPMITQSFGGCSTCGSGGGSQECGNGCPTGKCKPGRTCGSCSMGDFESLGSCGKCARLFGGIFECICCPDPCYEPCWSPAANSAFFQDHARPKSTMRVRWDAGVNMTMPDRNEFFWARIGQKGPTNRETSLNYNDFTLYTEAATGGFGGFIEAPFYRVLDSDNNGYDAAWGDMTVGTKSMFVDCELMQLTFQFKTFIPIGPSKKGFGTGHVSLEPSLLSTIKLAPKTFLQTQISEWIPIGGDDEFAGTILHYHTSLNHELCCKGAFQVVGTFEFSGYTFQDGAVTNAAGFAGPDTVKSSGESILYAGPGLRIFYCDRFDVGVGTAFSLTDDHFANQLYRTEFRLRY